jgi:hypothetical protein
VDPQVDLIALAAIDRETEITYIRREQDWATRALAEGRSTTPRLLPVLPASIAAGGVPVRGGNGNGHAHGDGHGDGDGHGHGDSHGHEPMAAIGPGDGGSAGGHGAGAAGGHP